MNIQTAVQKQLEFWHGIIDGTVADCPSDTLHRLIPGSTIGSIASTYAHAVLGEDIVVHAMFQGKPPIFEAQGWAAKTGVSNPGPMQNLDWAKTVKLNVPAFQEYAKTVYAATNAFLAGLTEADLQRKVPGPVGEQPLEESLVVLLATHYMAHGGEITALKGAQGLKGLPF